MNTPRPHWHEHDVLGARGLRLRVSAWDGEPQPQLLVLHGFLEQGPAWHEVASRLGRRTWAPDQRGHGLSDHVGAGGFYHFWDYVADADRVIDAMSPGAPVDVLGHSMGGTVAALLAATRPEKVRRLVLVEGLGPPDGAAEALPRARAFLDAERPRHGTFADAHAASARLRRFSPSLGPDLAHRLASRVLRPVLPDDPHADGDGPWTWTWDPLHRARAPHPFRHDVHCAALAAIRAPTLVVEGGASPWRPEGTDARLAALPWARHAVLPHAGHLVHHDDPALLADLVRAFLE